MKVFKNDEKCGHILSAVLVSVLSITVAFGSTAAAQQAKCNDWEKKKQLLISLPAADAEAGASPLLLLSKPGQRQRLWETLA